MSEKKKRTFNVQRSTLNAQRGERVTEEPGAYVVREENGGTFGVRGRRY